MTNDLTSLTGNFSILRFVAPEHQERLTRLFEKRSCQFGELIVEQGDEADAFYIVISGRARVVRLTEKGDELPLGTLRAGDEFGETALLEGGKRTASVRCSSAVEVLRLGRDDFLRLAQEEPAFKKSLELTIRFRALHRFLYEYSNFGRLPAPVLRSLVEKLTPVEFVRGQSIIRQGDPAGPMYIIRKGQARIYSSANGAVHNLTFCREGDYFGELSILNGSVRAASVEAVSDCQLLALAPEAVRDLKEKFPDFSHLMEERLAQYSADTEARVPLDFASELIPAAASVANKVEIEETAEPETGLADPFGDAEGHFRKKPGRIRHFRAIYQIDEMDCGAASLGMICQHFGRKVSQARVRQLCHTAQDGTSLKAICHAANELGLAARALKVSYRHLSQMPLPAIVHWQGNHWVVLFDVDEKSVRVADPALGIRKFNRSEFEEKWTGYAALFDYTGGVAQEPAAPSLWGRLAPFFREHQTTLLQVLGLAGIICLLQLIFPVFTQMVVDRVIVERDSDLLRLILLGMGAALVFTQIANLCQQYLLSFAAVRIDAGILDFLTRQLLALPMSYFNSHRTGDIQRRLDGARQVRQFVVQHGVSGFLALLELAGCLGLMALYSPALSAVFFFTLPLYLLLMFFSRKYLRPLFAELEESQGKYSSHQIDSIRGIEAVKAAAAEHSFRDSMLAEFLSVSRKMFRSNFLIMSYEATIQTVGMLTTALFLWVGARQVIDGRLTVGAFVAFNSLALMCYSAINRTLGLWDQMQLASVLLNRMNDIFEQEPEQGHDRSLLRPVPTLEGRIELRHVGFRYGGPESPDILKDITLDIPAGRMVALVGRSGCGKTTLVKLLAGLLEPTSGTICFDRIDLKTLNYRDLRRQIGMVLQENHLFDDTIARNIAFGDPEPDYDRVLWSAQLAAAHDFITRLPLGYETRVGETGLALSGGQKQRIAIARAVYHNPPVLLFDEATSALDTESERAIQDNLARLMKGRTSIVIAHRISTIRDAGLIVVLEQGQVAEAGTHDQLMAKRGLYFYLSSQQMAL